MEPTHITYRCPTCGRTETVPVPVPELRWRDYVEAGIYIGGWVLIAIVVGSIIWEAVF